MIACRASQTEIARLLNDRVYSIAKSKVGIVIVAEYSIAYLLTIIIFSTPVYTPNAY